MNRYDKEERIINAFQDLNFFEMWIYPSSLKNIKLYRSIHNRKNWKRWIDSSSKNELPPDFYNPKLKLMMDVMRIDDHAYVDENGRVINRHNERESILVHKLIEKNKKFKEIFEKGNLIIIPDSGLRGEKDHNYDFYVKNFKRVVEKHINKIKKYKKNHPGYKTIFFIFDESTPYMRLINCSAPKNPGELMYGELHYWWLDSNMLNIIKDKDIDYLIWMTPYKWLDPNIKVFYPLAMIYEVSKIDFNNLKDYKNNEMASVEQ